MKVNAIGIKRLVFLLLAMGCIVLSDSVTARDFKYLTTRNGLSHNGVYSIARDGDGLMWFSTGVGVDRYDGTSIKNYRLFDSGEERERIGRFNYVVADPDQNIWAFNVKGSLFRYVPQRDAFERVIEVPHSSNNISLLGVCFSKDSLALLYGSFGVKCYDRKSNQIFGENLMPGIYVTKIQSISDSRYAVGAAEGFFLLDFSSPTDCRITRIEPVRLNTRIQTLYYSSSLDCLYLGTFDGKIFRYDLASGLLRQIGTLFSNTPIRDITEGLHHSLYIATDGMGIMVLDTRTEKIIRRYLSIENYASGLSANSIYDIDIDEENRLWIATYIRGICILDKNVPDFTYFSHQAGNPNSLHNNLVCGIMEDRHGDMWFGTDDGVSMYDSRTGKWHHLLNIRSDHDVRYKILALCEASEGQIWVGGFACGATLIDKRTLQVKTTLREISTAHHGSGLNHVYVIYRDSEGIECVSNRNGHRDHHMMLYSAEGKLLMDGFPYGYNPVKWSGERICDLISDHGRRIGRFNGKEIVPIEGEKPNTIENSSLIMTADLWGDYREELVVAGTDSDGRPAVFVITAAKPVDKMYVTPRSSQDYRLWLARNKGGGYGSVYDYPLEYPEK